MSRRRRDDRTAEDKALEAEYLTVEVVCTGRGTHAREFQARYLVNRLLMQEMLARDLRSYRHDDLTFMECVLAIGKGVGDPYRVEPGGEHPYLTVSWECTRCGRNIRMKFGEDRRRAIALASEGVSRIDLSRLDRVRLSQ